MGLWADCCVSAGIVPSTIQYVGDPTKHVNLVILAAGFNATEKVRDMLQAWVARARLGKARSMRLSAPSLLSWVTNMCPRMNDCIRDEAGQGRHVS